MRSIITIVFVIFTSVSPAAQKGSLRAGAARIDITPAEDARLPMSGYAGRSEGHKGIHDHLYVRAIVVHDGTAQGAIVTCDLSTVSTRFWEKMSQRISREAGIPRENILLAATHTHGGPALGRMTDDNVGGNLGAYITELEAKMVDAVKQAQANLQPARVGFGTGRASVNMNRRARMPEGGWWLGFNPDGPSDKTVAVVRFETLAGEPIALFINYAVHGTVLGAKNFLITSDLPGATSRFVEQHYGDKVVASWTSGAAGDQNPIYRVGTDFNERAILGQLLGEEVIRVAGTIKTSSNADIRGTQTVVTCPGKKSPPGPRRRKDLNYEFLDADPVDIRLSVLMINHIAFAGVSGEVLTMIGTRLKKESPFRQTMMVTNCNGSSGYLPDDAAYDQISYEIVTTHVKRGCAEKVIVNGLLELMDGL
jgi:neutral ceramidase